MGKKNLIEVMRWWDNQLNGADIPSNQQLAMFHIILRLNANFWEPVQLSINKMSAAMCVSKRTCKTALEGLVTAGYLAESEGYYNVGKIDNSGNDGRRVPLKVIKKISTGGSEKPERDCGGELPVGVGTNEVGF